MKFITIFVIFLTCIMTRKVYCANESDPLINLELKKSQIEKLVTDLLDRSVKQISKISRKLIFTI